MTMGPDCATAVVAATAATIPHSRYCLMAALLRERTASLRQLLRRRAWAQPARHIPGYRPAGGPLLHRRAPARGERAPAVRSDLQRQDLLPDGAWNAPSLPAPV